MALNSKSGGFSLSLFACLFPRLILRSEDLATKMREILKSTAAKNTRDQDFENLKKIIATEKNSELAQLILEESTNTLVHARSDLAKVYMTVKAKFQGALLLMPVWSFLIRYLPCCCLLFVGLACYLPFSSEEHYDWKMTESEFNNLRKTPANSFLNTLNSFKEFWAQKREANGESYFCSKFVSKFSEFFFFFLFVLRLTFL